MLSPYQKGLLNSQRIARSLHKPCTVTHYPLSVNARKTAVWSSAVQPRAKSPRKEEETDWGPDRSRRDNKDIERDESGQSWTAEIGRETRRSKHRDRSKNHRTKPDGASDRPPFTLICNARTDMRSRTRSQQTSLSLACSFSSLCQFFAVVPQGDTVCSPSPDFGIKVLPSSSTSNLLSSLFFHYTSPLPL